MNELSPWVRKLVALALLVNLLAMLWGWGVIPLHKWSLAGVDALQEARFEASRLARAAEAAKHVSEAHVSELERTVSAFTMSGLSEAEAMTFAQGIITKLIKENHLALESIQSGPTVMVGTIRRIGFSLRAQGGESRVVDFVAAVEKNMPILKLESLTLRTAMPSGGDAGATAPNIFVEATVFAYWRPAMAGNGK